MVGQGFFLGRWAGRDDAQRVIDLHGIGIDDDPAAGSRTCKRHARLAAGSGTRYQHSAPLALQTLPPKAVLAMPVLSLIANPADPELGVALVAAVIAKTGGELNWLNHGVACDIIEPDAPEAETAPVWIEPWATA